ncbi:MAG: glycosyltransferase [Candidatus Dependentiae bacterium]|nr:glycosyltransferase [Candidatus Dependentiae bacterium]
MIKKKTAVLPELCRRVFIFLFLAPVSHASVDFDVSMQSAAYPNIVEQDYSTMMMNFFRGLYVKNNPDELKARGMTEKKIPNILHQIWLGGSFPEEYISLRKTWIDNHPDWTFVFWTDNPVNYVCGDVVARTFQELENALAADHQQFLVVDVRQLTFDNRGFYDQARNYGEKSDILKWEIVYRFGGVYIDTDFECLKPLDPLQHGYDFYTGLQPLDTHMVQLGAALFAATPGHPILKSCVETIKDNQHMHQIVVKTGPIHFTRCCFRNSYVDDLVNVVLPASYLYPCGYDQKGLPATVWQKSESFAIHHWAGSWLKPEAFEKR